MAFFDYDLQNKLKQYKFGIYLRRSSEDNEDKQVRSIEGQQLDLDDLKTQLGLDIAKQYEPEKRTAFKKGRPIFNELLQDAENGIIDAVLVWHSNRISRNYADGGDFVQLMSEQKIKIVLTPHGYFDNSPRDKAYLMGEFTRATESSDEKSVIVKRGNRTKLKAGYIPSGRLAEGFIHVKNNRDEYINIADPDRFPFIQKAIQLVLNQTHTPKEALLLLNNEWGYRTHKTKRTGDKPLSDSTWYKILSDPKYYYGELHRSEGVFMMADDLPKPYSREDYEKVQILLGNKSSRRKTKKDWPYTGLGMVCGECNGTIIMDEKWQIICPICKLKFHKSKDRVSCPECKTPIEKMNNPKILHYVWLYGNHRRLADGSKCSQPSLAVKDFDTQIDSLIAKFSIPESFKNWAIKWLQNKHKTEVHDRTSIKDNLQQLDTRVQKQIDNLLDLKLKELIDEGEYQRKKELLLLEQQQVRNKLKDTDKRADEWLELTEKTFNFSCYARYWFNHGTNQQKREILSTLGSNLMIKDKIVSLYLHKPFTILNGMQEKIEILLDVFEPDELLDNTHYSDTSTPVIPSLLRGRDSNPNKLVQSQLSYR